MKYNNTLILLAVIANITACTEQPGCGAPSYGGDGDMCEERLTATLTIDSAFSFNQQFSIITAGNNWNSRTNGRVYLTWEITDKEPDLFLGDCGPSSGGKAYPRSGRICFIQAEWPLLGVRAMHELGHFFGLGHETGLMRATILSEEDTITPEDVAHFDRLWNVRK